MVGTIDRGNGAVSTMRLSGEGISNSFAVDETGGVYIVSDKALYRFDANSSGGPAVSWRVVYPNSGIHKPGQSDAGSGTTPTLMGEQLGGDHRQRRPDGRGGLPPRDQAARPQAQEAGARPAQGQGQEEGEGAPGLLGPVFAKGAGSTDNSLIGTDRSLIVENNYGYQISAGDLSGGATAPGLTRIDVVKKKPKKRREGPEAEGAGEVPLPQRLDQRRARALGRAQALAQQRAGLHLHASAALGRHRRLVPDRARLPHRAHGLPPPRRHRFGFNNNYAPVTLGPDGTAYVGVLGGVVAFPGIGGRLTIT